MLLTKEVAAVSFLIAVFNATSAKPQPGIIRERHVIHAPIKFKYIHHYNIKKVPIVIKKHFHYYEPEEEHHPNQIDHKFEFQQFPKYKAFQHQSHRGVREEEEKKEEEEEEGEEYDGPEQSQEEQEYEDYEYE